MSRGRRDRALRVEDLRDPRIAQSLGAERDPPDDLGVHLVDAALGGQPRDVLVVLEDGSAVTYPARVLRTIAFLNPGDSPSVSAAISALTNPTTLSLRERT